jgi:AcrR family transcriptional regulator
MDKVKREYRSSLRTEQAEATRRRILDAARRLFARQGYQGTTMDQLAVEADVAIQTLYAVFGSKLNLAAAVVHDVLANVGVPEMVRQAGMIVDAEQALRYAAHVNRLVGERLVDLDTLFSVVDARDLARASERSRERDVVGVLATVLGSPRRRQDLSDDEAHDTLVALTSKTLYRTLVLERGWAPERYESWLGDLLVAALLR